MAQRKKRITLPRKPKVHGRARKSSRSVGGKAAKRTATKLRPKKVVAKAKRLRPKKVARKKLRLIPRHNQCPSLEVQRRSLGKATRVGVDPSDTSVPFNPSVTDHRRGC
jgi:hypothetical protein